MTNYYGTPCSICGKPLREGEDIVVCPECGTPYHRECYAKEGRCVHAAQHGSFDYERHVQPAADVRRCPNCGASNTPENLFCENCGTPLGEGPAANNAPQQNMSGSQNAGFLPQNGFNGSIPEPLRDAVGGAATLSKQYDGIDTRDWVQYIGNSAPYYLFQFERMDRSGRKAGICWSALFFAPYYFLYRKMWSWALASAVALCAVSVPSFLQLLVDMNVPLGFTLSANVLNTMLSICFVLDLVLRVALGAYAFYLYRRHAGKKILAMKAAAASDEEYHNTLARHSGPSMIALALGIAAMFAFSMAFTNWVGMDKVMQYLYF